MDLSNSINDGKKDWEKILKNRLNEATPDDVANSGHSTTPSDVSPNAGGGEKTDYVYDRITASNGLLRDLPEVKKIAEKLDLLKTKNLKKKVTATVRGVVLNVVDELENNVKPDMVEVINDGIQQVGQEKAIALKKTNECIKKFNKTIKDAIVVHQRNVGKQWTALPEVSSTEDFENFVINSRSGLNFINNIFGDVRNTIESDLQLSEARLKRNVRDVAGGDDTVRDDLQELYVWMKRNKSYFFFKDAVSSLREAILFITKAKILDATILGFQRKQQNILAARKGGAATRDKNAAAAQASEPVVDAGQFINVDEFFVLIDDLSSSEKLNIVQFAKDALAKVGKTDLANDIETKFTGEEKPEPKAGDDSLVDPDSEPENENPEDENPGQINETAKSGPGKIFTKKMLYVEEDSVDDAINTKKESINEGWKKYSEKNKDVKNGEEPEGFSIVMG
jgi:hypothetical protein